MKRGGGDAPCPPSPYCRGCCGGHRCRGHIVVVVVGGGGGGDGGSGCGWLIGCGSHCGLFRVTRPGPSHRGYLIPYYFKLAVVEWLSGLAWRYYYR